jgi:hypothetical protein
MFRWVLPRRFRVGQGGARHRRAAEFAGKLELDLARGEPLQELQRAFRILGSRGNARNEGADRWPMLFLFRGRGHVDLAHDLGRRRVVDTVHQARVLRERRALTLEHHLRLLGGVERSGTFGEVRNEAEQAGERGNARLFGEPGRPVLVDKIGAVGVQQRQVGLHDRIALQAAGRPAVHVGGLGRLRHLEDVVPGFRRRGEMIGVVVENLDVIDDDDRIELGRRAGEVLHAGPRLRRPQPHLEPLGQDVRIDLESDLVEALDDLGSGEFRHPVVVHDVDVVGAGLVEAVVLAALVPAVVVRLVVGGRDARLVGECLDEVVAERRHGVVLEAADGDRAAGPADDPGRKHRAAGNKSRGGDAALDDLAAAQRPLEQFADVLGLVAHF